MKPGFIDKLIDRLDRLEPGEAQDAMLRLVAEKGFLEKVFDTISEGLFVIDSNGEILYLNRAAGELFGLDKEKAIGRGVDSLIPSSEWGRLLESAREGRTVTCDLEVAYPETRLLNLCLTPVEGDAPSPAEGDGQKVEHSPDASVLLFRDITGDREYSEAKQESDRVSTLTMLAAGVAHELGNPLNSLTIHLQLLERRIRRKASAGLADELSGMLEIAQGEIKRLNVIIEEFLGAVRPTSPQRSLVRLNELVSDSIQFLEPELKQGRISVVLELHEGIPLLEIDGEQMRQAFYNLIRNSAQAMEGGGKLRVRTDLNSDEVFIGFSDDGKGIPSQNLGRLFEPYFSTRKSGTGLGLLIVQRIIREHGGAIEIESEEGKGTVVTVRLPRLTREVRFLDDRGDSGQDQSEE